MSGFPLVCYTVDSGSDLEDEEDEVKVKLEPVEFPAEEVVQQILEELLDSVALKPRDFSDMFIKEEPMDPDDIKEEFDAYRDDIKVEIDSDDCDSDDSSASSEAEIVKVIQASEGT